MSGTAELIGQALLDEIAITGPGAATAARVVFRVVTAMALSAVLGVERARAGKIAGVRTHMLTAAGAALFVAGSEAAEYGHADVSRVIQGVVTGLGFLGSGVILKRQTGRSRITGVTSAAGLWMTAAVGVAAGLGRPWVALFCTLLALVVLTLLLRTERWIRGRKSAETPTPELRRPKPKRRK